MFRNCNFNGSQWSAYLHQSCCVKISSGSLCSDISINKILWISCTTTDGFLFELSRNLEKRTWSNVNIPRTIMFHVDPRRGAPCCSSNNSLFLLLMHDAWIASDATFSSQSLFVSASPFITSHIISIVKLLPRLWRSAAVSGVDGSVFALISHSSCENMFRWEEKKTPVMFKSHLHERQHKQKKLNCWHADICSVFLYFISCYSPTLYFVTVTYCVFLKFPSSLVSKCIKIIEYYKYFV